jgi:RND family efflux transporter MFP subunit
LLLGFTLAATVALLATAVLWWLRPDAPTDLTITAAATRVTMPVLIVAGGELESSEAVDVLCDVEGQQTKIVEMLPAGTHIKKGQVVMQLDPSEVNVRLAAQQIKVTQADASVKGAEEQLKIQKNLAASQIAQAQLALTLSELDKKKYLEGDYGVEWNEIRGSIALAETDLQEAKDTLEYYRNLVKKGFRTPEQLRAKQQAVMRAEYYLSRDQDKLQVLERFTRERQAAELTAKAAEAKLELERAESSASATIAKAQSDVEVARATARLEREQLNGIDRQREHCSVQAPADGTLIYSGDAKNRIELGTIVHYKQRLFSVPDMTKMQVKAFVHESEVKKVRPGMPAEIRVDALPSLTLQGAVSDVATFYDPTRHWLSGGVKQYATIIKIDQLPDVGLKPGMTAQVSIRVGELSENLVVPIPAVAAWQGRHYCYVLGPAGVQRRQVKIGTNTANFVEIVEGLREGEKVALDARYRAASELDDGKRVTNGARTVGANAVAAAHETRTRD